MATTKITNPELFDLGSLNTALKLPSGTTAERPTSPSTGEWRYNTTTNLIEFYDGGDWRDLQDEDIPPVNSEHFNTVTYTGTGGTQAITGVGFQPDWVWIKNRNDTNAHILQDTTRGAGKTLFSSSTSAEDGTSGDLIASFDSDGFTVNENFNGSTTNESTNKSGNTYVAWCWKANGGTTSSNTDGTITSTVQVNTKGKFSVVQYTANGVSGATIGHGLGVEPNIVIVKNTNLSTQSWNTYVKDVTTTNAQFLTLNTTNANGNTANPRFIPGNFSSSVFSVGNDNSTNGVSGVDTYIAYCFASVAGYSSFGTYTGNGSDNGPIVNTGFEPAYIMFKRSNSSGGNWLIYDNKRSTTNTRDKLLFANDNASEQTAAYVDFLSNGFQIVAAGGTGNTNINVNGDIYIYMAFASDASAAPVLASSFSMSTYAGTDTTNNLTSVFAPSFFWNKAQNDSRTHNWFDTVRGAGELLTTNNTNAESTVSVMNSFNSDGVTISGSDAYMNSSSFDYVAYFWKAAELPAINNDGTFTTLVSANQAAGFSIVKFSTTSPSASDVFPHGLGAAPDVIIAKTLSAATPWNIYHTSMGTGKYLEFTTSPPQTNSNYFATVDATTFQYRPSSSNQTYVALCFRSITGFSSFGSYVGNGSAGQAVNVGFTPNWVLIKSTVGNDNWRLYDTARGITAGGYLEPNTPDPNNTNNAPALTTTATGWEITSGGVALGDNANGNEYLYFAFKENIPEPALPAGEAEFMVVAGGGGGGTSSGGSGVGGSGGGAGGLRTSFGSTSGGGGSAESNISLSAGTYTITIGAGGGTGGAASGQNGSAGADSSITGNASITSTGGGFGTFTTYVGGTGGSGGGGYETGGSGTANQGYNGSNSSACGFTYRGGAGGGAGAAASGKNGGAGLLVNGTTYAGGGGGGQSLNCGSGSGGSGGGADGQNANFYNVDATANTGGGGGGGVYNLIAQQLGYGASQGGSGGSGVVILQMRASDYSGVTTGSPTVTISAGLVTLKYTGSGTYVHS